MKAKRGKANFAEVEKSSFLAKLEKAERREGFPFFLSSRDFDILFSEVVKSAIAERRISEEAIESERKYLRSKGIDFSY